MEMLSLIHGFYEGGEQFVGRHNYTLIIVYLWVQHFFFYEISKSCKQYKNVTFIKRAAFCPQRLFLNVVFIQVSRKSQKINPLLLSMAAYVNIILKQINNKCENTWSYS